MDSIKIGYGMLLPSILEQVTAQGFIIDTKRAAHLQKQREAVFLLRASGVLVGNQADKCLERLHKRVTDAVEAREQ